MTLSCRTNLPKTESGLTNFPAKIIWAWERPENLEFLDANKFAVAFLAQTLELKGERVIFNPRRQPLKVLPAVKLIAVTRIESARRGDNPALSEAQRETAINFVLKTLELKNISAIQIDFDAAVSERDFYRRFLEDLRSRMPAEIPLSITALASFCVGDRWFADLPVAEAVPMIFEMGADAANIKSYLAAGNDFREPLCRHSYGIATDEPIKTSFEDSRRVYLFKIGGSWTEKDLKAFE